MGKRSYLTWCISFALSGGKPEEVRLQYHAQLLQKRLSA